MTECSDISNNTEETPKVLTITLDKLMVVDLLLKAERLSGLENSKAKLLSEAMPWETLHTTAVGSGGHVRQMSDSTARKSTTIKRNSILGAKYQMSPGYVPNVKPYTVYHGQVCMFVVLNIIFNTYVRIPMQLKYLFESRI